MSASERVTLAAAIGAVLVLPSPACTPSDLDVLDPLRAHDASAADAATESYCTTALCGPANDCQPVGAACSFAGQCCTLACVAGVDGGAPRCAAGPACAVAGARCTQSIDCCSNDCTAGSCVMAAAVAQPAGPPPPPPGSMCRPAGEACMHNPDCCGTECVGMRCELLDGCRVAGEICNADMDCCAGLCANNADGVGRCRPAGTCAVIGDICAMAADCCAGAACVADPSGAKRCQTPPQP